MADPHGGPESPTWAEIERDAEAGMQREGVELPPLRPIVEVDDPMLVLAQMNALRMAAGAMGMKNDPNWDATEAAVGDQMRRSTEEPPGEPTGPGTTTA